MELTELQYVIKQEKTVTGLCTPHATKKGLQQHEYEMGVDEKNHQPIHFSVDSALFTTNMV